MVYYKAGSGDKYHTRRRDDGANFSAHGNGKDERMTFRHSWYPLASKEFSTRKVEFSAPLNARVGISTLHACFARKIRVIFNYSQLRAQKILPQNVEHSTRKAR